MRFCCKTLERDGRPKNNRVVVSAHFEVTLLNEFEFSIGVIIGALGVGLVVAVGLVVVVLGRTSGIALLKVELV